MLDSNPAMAALQRKAPKFETKAANCAKCNIEYQALNVSGNWQTVCQICETATEAQADIANVRSEGMAKRIKAAGVPYRYQQARFDSYRPVNEKSKKVLNGMVTYANSLAPRNWSCAILSGNVGTGKTHLAVATIAQFLARYPERENGRAATAMYTTFSQYLMDIRATYQKSNGETERQCLNRYAKPDLLVIDEIGRHKNSEHAEDAAFNLIHARYEECRPTVVISNLGLNAKDSKGAPTIGDYIGEASLSRMREGYPAGYVMDWDDYRSRRGDEQ